MSHMKRLDFEREYFEEAGMTYDERREHEHHEPENDSDLPEGGAICLASLIAALLVAIAFGAWVYSHMVFR